MTREIYLQYRNKDDSYPFYYFYTQYKGKGPDLTLEEFYKLVQLWPFAQQAYEKVLLYYDHFFEVNKLENLKTGRIIKFL